MFYTVSGGHDICEREVNYADLCCRIGNLLVLRLRSVCGRRDGECEIQSSESVQLSANEGEEFGWGGEGAGMS